MAKNDLDNRFNYHPPKNDSVRELHERTRSACRELADFIDDFIPDGREKALALTNLEQSMFWSNAAIARLSN